MPVSRGEAGVAAAFAELAESLASGLDIATYLSAVCRHCVGLVGVSSAAIVYGRAKGRASAFVASSGEEGRLLATGPPDASADPWSECMTTGQLIVADLSADGDRWPWLAKRASLSGLTTVTMIPVTARGEVIAALGLLGGVMPDAVGIHLACSMADAAGTGILLSGELRRQQAAVTQLQSALTSRIVIEQAKGILAERWKVSPDEAFNHMRRHARATQRRLPEVAQAIIEGTAEVAAPTAMKPT